MSYNRMIAMGRLVKDPELKKIGSADTEVATFSVAIDSGFGDKKKVCFLEVVAWSKTATFIEQWFKRGDGIHIEGRLEQDTWTDKDSGKNRSKHKLVAERVAFPLSKKGDGGSDQGAPATQNDWNKKKEEIEEIPF